MKERGLLLGVCALMGMTHIEGHEVPLEERLERYRMLVTSDDAVKGLSKEEQAFIFLRYALEAEEDGSVPDEEAVFWWMFHDPIFNPHTLIHPKTGATILHFVALYGATEVVSYLLQIKKVPLTKDSAGCTPLHWACMHRSKEPRKKIVEMLLEVDGTQANVRDAARKNPLFYLTFPGQAGDLLLHAGADPYAHDKEGNTVLFDAFTPDAVQFFCSRSVDVNHLNKQGVSAFEAHLSQYVSFLDLARKIPSFVIKAQDEKKILKTLLLGGARVSRASHPLYHENFAEHAEFLPRQRLQRKEVIQKLMAEILDEIGETQDKLSGLAPACVVDHCTAVLPFLGARFEEFKELIKREEGVIADDLSLIQSEDFKEFLIILAGKKRSDRFLFLVQELVAHRKFYARARSLFFGCTGQEEEPLGELSLSKLSLRLQNPQNHATQEGGKEAPH